MASHLHILGCIASFVDQATMHPAWSPACGKLLGTECDTHTHTHTRPLCGALAEDLNRHLKAVETRGRKTEKAALKGQERKIGVAKSEYLALDWGREIEKAQETTKSARRKVGGREVYVHVCVRVCMNT